jgi:outer membrane protein assembly factor BamB
MAFFGGTKWRCMRRPIHTLDAQSHACKSRGMVVVALCRRVGLAAIVVSCAWSAACGGRETNEELKSPLQSVPAMGEQPRAGSAGPGSAGSSGVAAGPGNAMPSGAPSGPAGGGAAAEPAVVTSESTYPNEWRQMGYDERNHYHNPSETSLSPANAANLELKWTFTVAGFPPGSPVIAEGKVFVLASGGLYALDFAGGEQVWLRDDLTGTSSAAYADGAIYVHTGAAELYKVKASDGTTVWGPVKTYDNEAADGMSSPIIGLGKVIVGHSAEAAEIDITGRLANAQRAARGGVFAADLETGEMAWRYATIAEDAAENGAMVWSSVAIDAKGGSVFATTGNNWNTMGPNSDAFHMLDAATGAKMWVHQVRTTDLWNIANGTGTNRDTDFGANPIFVELDGKRIVAAGDKASEFWALDAATGMPLWSRSELSSSHSEPNGGILNNGAFDGEFFYVIANQPSGAPASILHALDPRKEGENVWPAKMFPKMTWGMPTTANGLLVVPVDDELHVLDAHTGESLTMFMTGGSIAAGGAAIAQGRIVVQSGLQYQIAGATLARNNNQIHCYGLPGDEAGLGTGAGMSPGGMGSGGMTPSGSPTFSGVWADVIVGPGCNGQPACHASEAGGGLNMRTKDVAYAALVGVAAMGSDPAGSAQQCAASGLQRVTPGDPDASLLVQKLEHTQSCGGPMPSAAETLPAAQLQQVRTWIANGARND